MDTMISTIDTLQDVDQASGALSNILGISSQMLQSSGALASVIDPNNTKTEALRTEGVNSSEVHSLSPLRHLYITDQDAHWTHLTIYGQN